MRKKGFTLLELIIVIVILGILASFALPQYFRAAERARFAEGVSLLGAFRSSQIRYKAERGVFCGGLCTTANLDVDVGTPKFFAAPSVQNPVVLPGVIATIVRNATQNNYNQYTLTITDDGTIACTDAGAPAACAFLQ